MSVEGTYKIRVDTPVGVQEGKMTLIADGDSLKGRLENAAGSLEFTDGKVKGNSVEFTVKIKTPMGQLKALVTGVVAGNKFSGVVKLPIGSAQIDGVRVL